MSRLTFEPLEDETPAWSPDGRFLAVASEREARTTFRVRSDGSEPPELLWKGSLHAHVADWSPAGRWLVIDVDTGPHFDVGLLDLDGEDDVTPLLDSRFDENGARVSPDGRSLAYVSNESGRPEVYVQSFPGLGDKRQISDGGGEQPVWSRDGARLLYRSPTDVMAVDVSSGEVSRPTPLVEDTFAGKDPPQHTSYDILPDGRLVMLAMESATERTYVNVVVNWFSELQAHVPR